MVAITSQAMNMNEEIRQVIGEINNEYKKIKK